MNGKRVLSLLVAVILVVGIVGVVRLSDWAPQVAAEGEQESKRADLNVSTGAAKPLDNDLASAREGVPKRSDLDSLVATSVVPGSPVIRTTAAPSPSQDRVLTPSNQSVARVVNQTRVGVEEVEAVQLLLRDYRTRMGENPTGTNVEIIQGLMGDNPARARLFPSEGQELNEKGELIDRWQTPYFFHQLSKNEMEVRSAGPDRTLWTADDIVTK